MTKEKITSLISQGEGINIEFKEFKAKLNRDIYESVCALLNRYGGHLFLGVRDDGSMQVTEQVIIAFCIEPRST